MLSIPKGSPIQAKSEHQARKRTIRRLARAMTQALRLHVDNPALVLAPRLGQPITLSNQEALEQWTQQTLHDLDLSPDSAAIEPLCHRLTRALEEVY